MSSINSPHCIQTDLRIIFLPMSRSPPVVKEYIFFPAFDPSKITSSLFPFLITSLCEMDIIIERGCFRTLVHSPEGSHDGCNNSLVETIEEARPVEFDTN